MASDIRFFRDSVAGRRGEILDAAVGVFYRRGYDAGTMREIADAVGVSEPALYRHFTGKEDLFEQLIAEAGARLLAEVSPLLEATAPDRIRDVIGALVENRRTAASTYLPVVQTIAIASLHNERFLEIYRGALITPLADRIADTVRETDTHYRVSVPEAELTGRVRVLMSLFVGHFVTSFVLGDPDGPFDEAVIRVMGWE